VLVLSGEQGSAKSTFSAILRALLDPNTAPLRALPRGQQAEGAVVRKIGAGYLRNTLANQLLGEIGLDDAERRSPPAHYDRAQSPRHLYGRERQALLKRTDADAPCRF
jgi:hypothetical protein